MPTIKNKPTLNAFLQLNVNKIYHSSTSLSQKAMQFDYFLT